MANSKTCMIYASSLDCDAILTYRLELESGALSPVGDPIEFAMPWAMAITPNRRFLYAVSHIDHALCEMAIDADDGTLKLLDVMPLPVKLNLLDPSYIHIDPTSRYLLTCDYWTDKIGSWEIGEDGRLERDSGAVVSVGSGVQGSRGDRQHPHSIQLDPQAKYVVVPFTGKDRIEFYTWRDGKIVSPSVAHFDTLGGTGPRHCAFHPTKPWMYFNNERGKLNSRITQYELTPGQPSVREKGTWSTLPAGLELYNAIADVHITPDGRFIYVSNRGHESIAGFAISEANGSLEALGQFPTGPRPTTFSIDSSGQFLISASLGQGTLSVHRVDRATGKLSEPQTTKCEWYGKKQKQLPPRPDAAPKTSGEKYARGKASGAPWVIAG
jgi:6-phosphogluconolactonase